MLSNINFKLPSFSFLLPNLKAMAPNHSNAKPASSSEEEEDSSSSSSSSSSSEDTPETPPPKKTTFVSAALQSHESEVSLPPPIVKPSATKSIGETSKTKTTLASSVTTSAKRPSQPHPESKKAKRPNNISSVTVAAEEVNGENEQEAKKPLFQRVFSEEDEVALLKGMFDYSVEKGADASADMNAFYDFIKKSIHTEVTKAQLSDKIRRLKKRFEKNQGRSFSNGSHEQKIFELSKKVWGKEQITEKQELTASVFKKVGPWGKSGFSLFDRRNAMTGLEEEFIKYGSDIIGRESRAALEEEWMKLHVAELEVFLQRNELINKQVKLVLENYKSLAQ